MQNRQYREDDREVLTNEGIKADLKRDLTSELVKNTCAILAIALLCFLSFQIVRMASEEPLLRWGFIVFFVWLAFTGIQLLAISTYHAFVYGKAIIGNHFFVTKDKLQHKEEGRNSMAYRLLLFFGFYMLALFNLPTNNRYEFIGGIYTVPVEAPHYRRSKKFAMNGATLFRRSHVEDSFMLVSFKPGKPVKIYPEDVFDYKDSSPL